MAAVRHLGFVARIFGPRTKIALGRDFITVYMQNLVGIDAVILMIRKI